MKRPCPVVRFPSRVAIASTVTLAALLSLAGCGSPPKITYYTLAPSAYGTPTVAARETALVSIAVGPVTLPDLVDRPQLVVRSAENQVALLDQHRWAEPLKRQIPRVLAGHLSRLLGTPRVSVYPAGAGLSGDLRVRVDIQRFESVPGSEVMLEAFWSITPPGGEARLGRSTLRVPVAETGYAALVAAHGVALQRLSEELAESIRARRTAL
jgi:uncharacterized lipoprotein YmbA